MIHFDFEELILIHQLGKVILSTLNKTFLARYLAQRCCSSSGTCCDFANGGGNYGGGYNNNNKPGNCPPYNGRKKRSPRGRFPGNNGYNNGGQGYNPGHNNGFNNGGYNPGYGNGNGYNNNNGGSCIRDANLYPEDKIDKKNLSTG